ncbi:hypothetical protein DFO45_3266 [Azorhizobium sp. AG788]|uniref:hypothetical protein n=1 Tax=Azorhizobium sp. AG788 TaxID=2183897 RepID=UPI001061B46C|nr:hypothetical protein [Azorhizobium sp. AG788]TDT92509.1 hypothetical protein DFO45_3266 [Azorhizobium sp. AG788]
MLHAFNQKGVRRVLVPKSVEHLNDKNEDAVTSMVFSPLAFMTAADALAVIVKVLGTKVTVPVGKRDVVGHKVELWPQMLKSGPEMKRCEPDVVLTFTFDEGPELVIIGEMKWDWAISREALVEETTRQGKIFKRSAKREVLQFVITKSHVKGLIPAFAQLTWNDVSGSANSLSGARTSYAVSSWGKLVHDFLRRAGQLDFHGFNYNERKPFSLKKPAFISKDADE